MERARKEGREEKGEEGSGKKEDRKLGIVMREKKESRKIKKGGRKRRGRKE